MQGNANFNILWSIDFNFIVYKKKEKPTAPEMIISVLSSLPIKNIACKIT